MSKLSLCPFCGSEAQIKDLGGHRYHVVCTGCPVRLGSTWGSEESVEYLTCMWNRRHVHTIQSEADELRERIALAIDGIDNGYSTEYVRNVLKDAS